MDLMDSDKSTRRVSRTSKKLVAASPSSPVILLGSEKQVAEVEMESGSRKMNLEAGQDVDNGGE